LSYFPHLIKKKNNNNNNISSVTLSLSLWIAGEGLTCNTCRVGFADKCLYRSTETCSDDQPNCYRGQLGEEHSCDNLLFFSVHDNGWVFPQLKLSDIAEDENPVMTGRIKMWPEQSNTDALPHTDT